MEVKEMKRISLRWVGKMAKRTINTVLAVAITVIMVVAIAVPIAWGSSSATEGISTPTGYYFGHDSLYMGDEWMRVTDLAIHFWGEDHGIRVLTKNARFDPEIQIKDYRYMVAAGVDAIISSPVDAVATKGITEWVVAQGVPLVTYNTDVDTTAVKITVMFGNKRAAVQVAEKCIEYLKEAQGTEEPSGLIIGLQGAGAVDTDKVRADGYKEVFDKYPGINYVWFYTKSVMSEAQARAHDSIMEYGRPVAIVSQNTTNGRGGYMALKRTDMTELRGEPDHVWMGSIGAPSEWIEMMKEGKVDYGYVQPNLFYGPLAMYFAIQLIEKGEAGLPNVGQTITCNPNKPNGHQPDGTYNLVITGYEHLFEPWALDAQTWFPTEVVTNYEHRWFKVSGMEVTPETADNPSIWGNAAGEWLKPIK